MTVHKLRKRGARGIVQTNGEIMFMPGGDVSNWKRIFSARLQAEVAKAAPAFGDTATYPRTLRPHGGPPLKTTITRSSTRMIRTRGKGNDGARVYTVVGSTAPHSLYVDQGTGAMSPTGNGPYETTILPPTAQGAGDMFDGVQRKGGPKTITIKGQRGKYFFEEGIDNTYRKMGLRRAANLKGGPKVGRALASVPQTLEIPGNTNDSGLGDRIGEWRKWQREAWDNAARVRGAEVDAKIAALRRQASRSRSESARAAEAMKRRRNQPDTSGVRVVDTPSREQPDRVKPVRASQQEIRSASDSLMRTHEREARDLLRPMRASGHTTRITRNYDPATGDVVMRAVLTDPNGGAPFVLREWRLRA